MRPAFLTIGDKVAIVAPAGRISAEELKHSCEIISSWGLIPTVANHVLATYGCFAGTPDDRRSDLQEALNNREIKAIICARGGYGTIQVIDEIDFSQFELYPKWIVGYSDITVLHNAVTAYDISSIHGAMARNIAQLEPNSETLLSLKNSLFGTLPNYFLQNHSLNRTGTVEAKIIGGNLSVFFALRGTHLDLDFSEKILFIEDIGEKPHHIDRIIYNLKISGILEELSGLIVGQFSDIEEDEGMCKTVYELIAESVEEFDYPVCFNFPAGHTTENLPLILNNQCQFEVSDKGVTLKFKK